MKNILVPTDFSPCANNAVEAAAMLAKRFGATLHLYACLDLPGKWQTLSKKEQEQETEALAAIRRTEMKFEELKKKYEGVSFQTAFADGKLHENIADYARIHGMDIIVMGSHGASGKNEYFIGSNTQKVVRMVHCPVLVVKEPLARMDFRRVVFASDFQEEEMASFVRFLSWVKPFMPEVHLVAVQSSPFDTPMPVKKEAMQAFKNACKPLACKTHVFKDFSVSGGIRHFSEKISADLIALSNHHRHPLKRMLVGSNVEALVNHADLPVLTIDFA